jgi:hypothetical protein
MERLVKKKTLAMEFGAQIQMHVQPIPKPSFHEAHSVECLFIFSRSKDLDSSNLGQFDEF